MPFVINTDIYFLFIYSFILSKYQDQGHVLLLKMVKLELVFTNVSMTLIVEDNRNAAPMDVVIHVSMQYQVWQEYSDRSKCYPTLKMGVMSLRVSCLGRLKRIRSRENTHTTTKKVRQNAGAYVKTRYDVTSILEVG